MLPCMMNMSCNMYEEGMEACLLARAVEVEHKAAQGAVFPAGDHSGCLMWLGSLQQLHALYLPPMVQRMQRLHRLPCFGAAAALC